MPEAPHGTIAGHQPPSRGIGHAHRGGGHGHHAGAGTDADPDTGTDTDAEACIAARSLRQDDDGAGVKFRVVCANNSPVNRLEIIPTGLKIDNRPISREIDGTVTGPRSQT